MALYIFLGDDARVNAMRIRLGDGRLRGREPCAGGATVELGLLGHVFFCDRAALHCASSLSWAEDHRSLCLFRLDINNRRPPPKSQAFFSGGPNRATDLSSCPAQFPRRSSPCSDRTDHCPSVPADILQTFLGRTGIKAATPRPARRCESGTGRGGGRRCDQISWRRPVRCPRAAPAQTSPSAAARR